MFLYKFFNLVLQGPTIFSVVTNTVVIPAVTTYPSAGGQRGAHGCVFHGRKMRGLATNVYLRKTPEKLEKGVVYEL